VARARQERAEITRQAILDGAAAAFDATGYGSTSLSDVAKQAGVTKGALYFHFSSKEALANALVEEQRQYAELLARVPRPGVQTLIDMGHRMAHGLRNDVRLRAGVRLVVEFGSFDAPDPAPYSTWINAIRDCLVHAQARGDVQPGINVTDLATVLSSAFTGLQLTSHVLTARKDLDDRVTDLWRYLLPGVVPARRVSRFEPAGSPGCRAELGLPPLDVMEHKKGA
jgi:AcrR family transcriptional regulator